MLPNRAITNLTVAGGMFLSVVLGCVPPKSQSSQPRTLPSNTQSYNSQPTNQTHWDYYDSTDEMGRGRILRAVIQSTNTISLGFPYEGEQHATLTLRQHPKHGNDVYIRIEKGQLLDSDYNDRVSARFDNDKVLTFSSSGPADLSSETLFLNGAFATFVSRLKTAKTLRMEVPVYQAGNQIFTFDVAGFDWKK